MRTSIDKQHDRFYRQRGVETRQEAKTGPGAHSPPCYEYQRMTRQSEAIVGASQTPPVCERNLLQHP